MVAPTQRWSASRKCPICGGWEGAPRGHGTRCTGYLSSDGEWILCTRPEHAGRIVGKGQAGAETFAHRRYGECGCGVEHGPARAARRSREAPDVEATYDYRDADGELLFQVVRKTGKRFVQRRPLPDHGEGRCSACDRQHDGWLWSLSDEQASKHGLPTIRRVLYRVPELVAAPADATVYIVEGEKDCDALRKLGLVATCNPGGAGKWGLVAKHAQEVLRGRPCVVIADDDPPDEHTGKRTGHEHAKQVAKSLRCAWLTLPDAKDAAEWIGKGGTREALETLARDATAKLETKRAAPSQARTAIEVVRGDWTRELLYKSNEDGSEKSSLRVNPANVITIFVHDERWKDVFAYNEFAEWNCTLRRPPWRHQDNGYAYDPGEWTEEDTTRARAWLSAEYKLDVSGGDVRDAVGVVCRKRCFHDVREWLESLKYDGTKRIRSLLQTVFGAEDSEYVRSVCTMWLVSAVARIYRPGCKVDTSPVLEGQPGIRKSSLLRTLVGDKWFFEMCVGDLGSLDAMQTLRSKWVYEIPEVDKFGSNARHRESFLAFMSRQSDRYRASYGHRHIDRPRQSVGVCTTNKDQWITDDTGALERRVLPIRCVHGDADSIAYVERWRDQLWAEAVELYRAGERWYITDPEMEEIAKEEQGARRVTEPIRQQIADWVNARAQGGLKSRAEYGVTGEDIMRECLNLQAKDRTPAMAMVVGRVMRSLGWSIGRQETRNGVRVRLYRPDQTDAAEPTMVEALPTAPETTHDGAYEPGRAPAGPEWLDAR